MGLSSPNTGIIVSLTKIANATNISGTTLPFSPDTATDVGVELTLEIGKPFQPKLSIFGNFKRDETGTIVDWGSAYRVYDLLHIMAPSYLEELKSAYTINPDAITSMIGKEFWRLTYITGRRPDDGRLRYTDWTTIGAAEAGKEALIRRWEKSLAKGYPKNFHPEVLEDGPINLSF